LIRHCAAAGENDDDADDAETARYCVGGVELLSQRALIVLELPLGMLMRPERLFPFIS
jgi:hypothetical protein